jgi:cyanosortase A-associated protein
LNYFRLSLLAANLAVALFIFGKSSLDPNFADVAPFAFPSEVPLPQWQLLESQPLPVNAKQSRSDSAFKAGRLYRYRQNDYLLDVEVRYVVRTEGATDKLILKHPTIQSSSPENMTGKMRQRQGIGYHTTFLRQGRAYLSSCINPYGGSTVTQKQFIHNRDTYDLQLNRVPHILLGREDWKDYRCLWTYSSIPLNNISSEKAYQTLELAWDSWYQWWRSRFPKP